MDTVQQPGGWEFVDDRGTRSTAPDRPRRVITYLQAGAALDDLGVRPAGLFGSRHDGDQADPFKAGALARAGLPYFGSGDALRTADLLEAAPDLVVAVSYGGGAVYGLTPEDAAALEKQLPLVVLDVGRGTSLARMRERCADLARTLGGGPAPRDDDALRHAERRLTAAAGSPSRGARPPGILALSAAGPDTVHLARPDAWPDLRALSGLGAAMLAPEPAGNGNWATTDWDTAADLHPAVVLADGRANATPEAELAASGGWQALRAHAAVLPWNPEKPATARAHAAFLDALADTLETPAAR